MTTHIPERFRKAVLLHLFKNLHPQAAASTPLILGVHGPSGEGKTFQTQKLLEEVGVHIEFVSGGDLESRDAGEPAELIRTAYRSAASYRAAERGRQRPAAVFVNDIDAAVGDWGDQVQYTVNRQNVFGELMHLTDFPHEVGRRTVLRVPIVVTGNDFTKLYGPLLRLGRMQLFSWLPTDEERLDVVCHMYPELSRSDSSTLLMMFPGQPTTFYAQLRGQVVDDVLWAHIEYWGGVDAFEKLSFGEVPRVDNRVTLDRLVAAGHALLGSRTLVNYLEV